MSPPNIPSNRSSTRREFTPEDLERLVDRAVRDQPEQQAPVDLENKVMAAIARRAAAPWWHGSFAQWPVAVRILFLAASAVFVKLGLEASSLIVQPLDAGGRAAAVIDSFSWIYALFVTFEVALRSLPTGWLYYAILVIGGLYLMVFGVSAAAYRTLYASR